MMNIGLGTGLAGIGNATGAGGIGIRAGPMVIGNVTRLGGSEEHEYCRGGGHMT